MSLISGETGRIKLYEGPESRDRIGIGLFSHCQSGLRRGHDDGYNYGCDADADATVRSRPSVTTLPNFNVPFLGHVTRLKVLYPCSDQHTPTAPPSYNPPR